MRLCWGDRFGEDGQVSVFICDPDRNVIELRGCDQGSIEGVTRYVPSPSADRELGLNLRAKPKVGFGACVTNAPSEYDGAELYER
jgi:hypothetical protein